MSEIDISVAISSVGSERVPQVLNIFLDHPPNLEVVLIIDKPDLKASSFLPESIIKNPRLKILSNPVNLGPTLSFNKAIQESTGNIIVRADDDDLPDPQRINEIVAFFDANQDVDLVYSFARGIDENSGQSWIIDGPIEDSCIKKKLLQRNFIVHPTLAFRRDSLAKINFYDDTFRFAQDYDLYLRSIRAGLKFGCIPKILVTRYYHSNSITVQKRKKQILNSMAARLLHVAWLENNESPWPVILRYIYLLAIPDWARQLRRKLGLGK